MTISTGFVVDDAIVMIENIARLVEEGVPPLRAALEGSEQIGFTIVSLTVSLIAVLIPLLFMGDIVGRLFREFAVTLSVTILVSAIVSLTLTPMMCALILRPVRERTEGALARILDAGFKRVIRGYDRTLRVVLRHGRQRSSSSRRLRGDGPPLRHRPEGVFPVRTPGRSSASRKRRRRSPSPPWPRDSRPSRG